MKVQHFIFTLFLLLGAIGSSIAALSSAQVSEMQAQMHTHAEEAVQHMQTVVKHPMQ